MKEWVEMARGFDAISMLVESVANNDIYTAATKLLEDYSKRHLQEDPMDLEFTQSDNGKRNLKQDNSNIQIG